MSFTHIFKNCPLVLEKKNKTKEGESNEYQQMINRYLKLNNYEHDILDSDKFPYSRQCMKAKKKLLKELGLGNKPNVSDEGDFSNKDKLLEESMSMNCAEVIVTNLHKIIEVLWSKISRYCSGIKLLLLMNFQFESAIVVYTDL